MDNESATNKESTDERTYDSEMTIRHTIKLDKMFFKFESYFEDNSIYKTLFICSCDEEVYDILDKLENNNHSVSVLFYDDIYNERDNYYNKLQDFNTENYRIFY
jgi:hypothetical protein